jgi:hypothetical protein
VVAQALRVPRMAGRRPFGVVGRERFAQTASTRVLHTHTVPRTASLLHTLLCVPQTSGRKHEVLASRPYGMFTRKKRAKRLLLIYTNEGVFMGKVARYVLWF